LIDLRVELDIKVRGLAMSAKQYRFTISCLRKVPQLSGNHKKGFTRTLSQPISIYRKIAVTYVQCHRIQLIVKRSSQVVKKLFG